ncbi:T1SS secreted agglutinin (RTX) [hydrothermal vent metagenome]|uniref:T1SS secreted agglutinin (RTX) n=1 Tax=hydrothermal vent metagenome TaxID=652676 RepID=A0A3B0W493_9ZZZZ
MSKIDRSRQFSPSIRLEEKAMVDKTNSNNADSDAQKSSEELFLRGSEEDHVLRDKSDNDDLKLDDSQEELSLQNILLGSEQREIENRGSEEKGAGNGYDDTVGVKSLSSNHESQGNGTDGDQNTTSNAEQNPSSNHETDSTKNDASLRDNNDQDTRRVLLNSETDGNKTEGVQVASARNEDITSAGPVDDDLDKTIPNDISDEAIEDLANRAPDAGDDTELSVDEGSATLNGQVIATDVNTTDVLSYQVVEGSSIPDGFSFSEDGSWQFNAQDEAYNHLNVGDSVVFTVPIVVSDNFGASDTTLIKITIFGTNDAPVAGAEISAITDEGATTISGQFTSTDVDDGASATFTVSAGNSAPAGFVLNADGSYTFDPADSAYDHLNVGDSEIITIPVTVTDENGASDTSQVQITISGTNDAPIAGADVITNLDEGGATINGQLTSSDIDDGASATFTVSTGSTAPDGFVLNPDGSYSFNPGDASYDNLSVGDNETITIPVTVTDDNGATDTSQIQITVTGTNDAPVAGAAVSATLDEGSAVINGQLTSTDVDAAATATWNTSSTQAGFVLNADGSYSFDPADNAYDHLNVGDSEAITIPVIVTDDNGATDTTQIQITVTGTNDAPIAGVSVTTNVVEGAAEVNGQLTSSDVDDGATATFTVAAGSSTPAGFVLDADGSYSFDPSDVAYDYLNVGDSETLTIPVTVMDDNGASDTMQIQITVSGSNDAPTAIDFTGTIVDENALPGTVVAQMTTQDVDDGEIFTYAIIDDDSGLFDIVGDQIVVKTGADIDFEIGSSHDVSVQVTDANGLSYTQTVSLTVNDINEAPTDIIFDTSGVSVEAGLIVNNDGASNEYGAISNFDNFPTTEITLEIQFSSNMTDASSIALASYATGGSNNEFLLFSDGSGNLNIYINGSARDTGINTSNLLDGNTHQLSVTWDSQSGALDVYVDGVAEYSGIHQQGNPIESGGTLIFGQEQDNVGGGFDASQNFEGTISDVRIFDEVRTPQQIADNANGEISNPGTENGLVSYYNFNSVSGDEVTDLVGNNTLTLNNGASVSSSFNASTAATVDENATTGTVVATLSTEDIDAGDSHSYVITDDASNYFEVVGNEIRVKAGADINFESESVHEVTIQSTDSAGNTYSEIVSIEVNDVNEAPTDIVIAGGSIDENTVAGTVAATLATVDEDSGETFSYTLTDGSGLFEISGSDIVVKSGADIDFESAESHDVSVQVTDSFGNTLTENFTINVNDLIENIAPTAVDDVTEGFSAENASLVTELTFEDGLPATLVGSVSAESGGQVGDAADFSSAKVEVSGLSLSGDAGAQTTVSMWIQANPEGGWEMLAASDRYDMVMLNGDIGFNTAGGDLFGTDASELADGEWHQVVGVFTNGDVSQNSIYIDGVEQSMSQIQGTPNNGVANIDSSSGNMYFGSWGANNNYRFSGSMDEVKVFDGALSSFEVTELYDIEADSVRWDGGALSTNEDVALIINPAELLANDTDPDGDVLVISSVQDGDNGTVGIDAGGNVVFTPDANYNGEASFTYTVSDGNGGEDTATVILNVSNVNDLPTIDVVSTITVDEDGSQQFNYSTADIDSSNVVLSGESENGTVVVNTNGTVTFTPDENFYGDDTITLTATDNNGGVTTQQISVTVNPIEDAPDAIDDGNFDPQSATLTAEFNFDSGVPTAIVGSVVVESDGQISDAANFSSAKVEVSGLSLSGDAGAQTTVSMWIQANPEGGWEMLAASDRYDMVMLNGDIGFNTAGGDLFGTDASELADGEWHQVVGVFTNGDVSQNSIYIDGVEQSMSQIQGTPNNGVANIDSSSGNMYFGSWGANNNYRFSGSMDEVKVFDGVLSSDEIKNLYDIEAASTKWDTTTLSTSEDTALVIDPSTLLANDTDVDGDTLSIISVQDAQNGTVEIDAGGNIIFTPAENYNGETTFTYTIDDGKGNTDTASVTLNVEATNDAPDAGADVLVSVDESTAVITGQLVATDVDGVITGYTISAGSSAPDGFVLNADGSYSFDPADSAYDNLNVGDSVVLTVPVTVTDDNGATNTAQIQITVVGTNDAPVAGANVTTSADEGVATINGQLTSSDSDDGATITFSVSAGSTSPDGFVLNANGSYNFNPDDSSYNYLNVGDSEVLTIPVTVTDENGATDTSQIQITITGTNDAPVASVAISATVDESSAVINGQLTSSDVDDAASATFTISTGNSAPDGFVLNTDGSYSFDPADSAYDYLNVGNSEVVTIPVTVTDDNGATDTTQIQITISGTNDAPVAGAVVTASVDEGSAVISGQITSSDADATSTAVYSISAGSTAPDGFTMNADGSYSFDPADSSYDYLGAGDNVVLIVPVTVTDDNGATDTTQVEITVQGTNDSPVVQNVDLGSTNEDNSIVITEAQLLANSSDVDSGAALSVDSLTLNDVSQGALTDNGDGTWNFSPANNYSADDVAFDFTVSDGVVTNSATAVMDIVAVADVPTLTATPQAWAGTTEVISATEGSAAVSGGFTISVDGWQTTSDTIEQRTTYSSSEGDWHFELNTDAVDYYPDAANIYQDIQTQDGASYELSFDFSARPGIDANTSRIEVLWDGAVIDTISADGSGLSDTSWSSFNYTVTGDGDVSRLEFREDGVDLSYGRGGLLDNISLTETSSGFTATGNEDTAILLPDLSITLNDQDGSESSTLTISDIPVGAVLTDGANSFTASTNATNVDITSWSNDSLTVTPPLDFDGQFDLTITTTATETSNGDTSSTVEALTVNVVNDYSEDAVNSIYGTNGNNYLSGTDGDDYISGRGGNDTLVGGAGDDVLNGGAGNDSASGGEGNDTYVMNPFDGSDYFSGGDGGGWIDTIDITTMAANDPDNPWTIEVAGVQVEYNLAAGALELNPDTAGVITFNDGSELSFDGVERIEW